MAYTDHSYRMYTQREAWRRGLGEERCDKGEERCDKGEERCDKGEGYKTSNSRPERTETREHSGYG